MHRHNEQEAKFVAWFTNTHLELDQINNHSVYKSCSFYAL